MENTQVAVSEHTDLVTMALTPTEVEVIEERRRQELCEGFTPAHDDKHTLSELVWASVSYLLSADAFPNRGEPPPSWPWEASWWKPKDYRCDLVRATALLIAALEMDCRKRAEGGAGYTGGRDV